MAKKKILAIIATFLLIAAGACGAKMVAGYAYLSLRLNQEDLPGEWLSIPGPWIGEQEEIFFEPGGAFVYRGDEEESARGSWRIENNKLQIVLEKDTERAVSCLCTLQELQPTYLLEGKELQLDSIVYNGTRFWLQEAWDPLNGWDEGNGELDFW